MGFCVAVKSVPYVEEDDDIVTSLSGLDALIYLYLVNGFLEHFI